MSTLASPVRDTMLLPRPLDGQGRLRRPAEAGHGVPVRSAGAGSRGAKAGTRAAGAERARRARGGGGFGGSPVSGAGGGAGGPGGGPGRGPPPRRPGGAARR